MGSETVGPGTPFPRQLAGSIRPHLFGGKRQLASRPVRPGRPAWLTALYRGLLEGPRGGSILDVYAAALDAYTPQKSSSGSSASTPQSA